MEYIEKHFGKRGRGHRVSKGSAIYSIHTRVLSHVNDLSNGVLHLYFLHFIFCFFDYDADYIVDAGVTSL